MRPITERADAKREVRMPGEDAPPPAAKRAIVPHVEETPEEKIARLEAKVADLEAAGGPAAHTARPGDAYRAAALDMRSADVDASKLREAVLTRDGWVCPAFIPDAPLLRK